MSHSKLPYPGVGHAILMTLAFLGIQFFGAVVVTIVATILHGQAAAATAAAHPVVTLTTNLLAFATILAWGYSANRVPWSTLLPCPPISVTLTGALLAGTLGLAAVLSEVGNLVVMLWPIPASFAGAMRNILANDAYPWLSVALVVVVAPITEELLFRGVILRGLLGRMRPATAIGVSALLFALVHANPWQFFGPLAIGLLLGWCYVRTGSLLPCILGHAVNNALAQVLRHAPFDLPGVTGHYEQPVHQPWWLTLGGAVVLLLGLWWFHRTAPPPPPPPPLPPRLPAVTTEPPPPPILG